MLNRYGVEIIPIMTCKFLVERSGHYIRHISEFMD